jgi:FkbM family methyltransferase
MLKPNVQRMLKWMGFHERLRESYAYDLYWRLADRRRIDKRSREVAFYRSLLDGFRAGDLIFDVGANVGEKTDIFLRLGARVVAVEPDEAGQGVLRDKFLRYRLAPKPVLVVGKAVSDKQKVETMWVDGPGSALNTLSQKWVASLRSDKARFEHTLDSLTFSGRKEVETTTIEQLVTAYGPPFFVKIDVEGYELAALRGMRRPVPYLSFEVNLPEFRPEALECVELLGRMGANGKFNYAAECETGLLLDTWLSPQDFLPVLGQVKEKSIEVFWKTTPEAG